MKISIKESNKRTRWISKNLVGVQGQPLALLLKLLRRPGIYSTAYQIGNMNPYNDSHFIVANLIQYVAKLRRNLFNENGTNPKVILVLSRPFRIAFNGKLSFCLIEPENGHLQFASELS